MTSHQPQIHQELGLSPKLSAVHLKDVPTTSFAGWSFADKYRELYQLSVLTVVLRK